VERRIAIAVCVLICTFASYGQADERVVRMRDSSTLSLDPDVTQYSVCNGHRASNPLIECNTRTIENQAWESGLTKQQLRDKYTFTVYTTTEIEQKLSSMRDDIAKMQQTVDHYGQVLDDTKKAILKTVDELPSALPSDPTFYKQMHEQLKSDIAAELEKAKKGTAGPIQ
jgi:hypothetical protein